VPSYRLAAAGGQLRGKVGFLLGVSPLGLNYLCDSSSRGRFLPRLELFERPKVRMFARRNIVKTLLVLPGLGFLRVFLGYLGSLPEGKRPEFDDFDLVKDPRTSGEPLLGQREFAWVVSDQKGSYALLNRCTHLGCPVRFDTSSATFSCPCHGSVYSTKGEVLKGPAPRPLKRLKLIKVSESRLRALLASEVDPGFRL